MKFYSLVVVVLLLNLSLGNCSECEDSAVTNFIETTTPSDEPTTTIPTTTSTPTTTAPTTITTTAPTTITTTAPTTITTTTTAESCLTTTQACTTETSTIDQTKRVLTLSNSSDCSALKSGTILVDANHCRRYYMCSSGRTKHYRCPAGKWYDRQTLTCRLRNEVNNCPANRN